MPTGTVDPIEERVAALEDRVGRLEGATDTVVALRADLATIAETLDPNLRAHVAELDGRVGRHGLLLARLLDKTGDDET
jgi:hypothetical protein